MWTHTHTRTHISHCTEVRLLIWQPSACAILKSIFCKPFIKESCTHLFQKISHIQSPRGKAQSPKTQYLTSQRTCKWWHREGHSICTLPGLRNPLVSFVPAQDVWKPCRKKGKKLLFILIVFWSARKHRQSSSSAWVGFPKFRADCKFAAKKPLILWDQWG